MSSEFKKDPDEEVKGLVIEHYGDRYFALYEGETLICVTLYRREAQEIKKRLEEAYNLIQEHRTDTKPESEGREIYGTE